MIHEVITIVERVKNKITDSSDMVWTGYDTAKQLRDELNGYIDLFQSGDSSCLEKLHIHFLPTCTFQEHSISNGWADEYLTLAERFDRIYALLKKESSD